MACSAGEGDNSSRISCFRIPPSSTSRRAVSTTHSATRSDNRGSLSCRQLTWSLTRADAVGDDHRCHLLHVHAFGGGQVGQRAQNADLAQIRGASRYSIFKYPFPNMSFLPKIEWG